MLAANVPHWVGPLTSLRHPTVRTYPRGFVTFEVPLDMEDTNAIRVRLDGPDGTMAHSPPLFAHEARPGTSFAESNVRFNESALRCTQQLPPGTYHLTADVERPGGGQHSDKVTFAVP